MRSVPRSSTASARTRVSRTVRKNASAINITIASVVAPARPTGIKRIPATTRITAFVAPEAKKILGFGLLTIRERKKASRNNHAKADNKRTALMAPYISALFEVQNSRKIVAAIHAFAARTPVSCRARPRRSEPNHTAIKSRPAAVAATQIIFQTMSMKTKPRRWWARANPFRRASSNIIFRERAPT